MAEASFDLLEELRAAARKRLNNPFYFSLLVSFAAANCEAIYILLWPTGDHDAWHRITAVRDLYDSPYYWRYIWKVIILPIGFACLYVSYIPRFLFMMDRIRRKDEVKQLNEIKEIDGGLAETQRIIGQLILEKKDLLDTANKELAERRKAEQEVKDLKQNYVQSLDQQNTLRDHYRQVLAEAVLRHDGWRNTIIAIRAGRNVRDQSRASEDLQMFKLIELDSDGAYTLTDEGKAIAKHIA